MDRPPCAWVLNLDAEHELEAVRSYAPTDNMRAITARQSPQLVGALVAQHDVIVTDEGLATDPTLRERAHGLEGRAWSPTPRALAMLARAGAVLPDAPSLAVLRRANARDFASLVRAPLARASFDKYVALDREAVFERLATPARLGWLVRRTFGAAGRGRRRIRAGRPSDAEIAWIDASLRFGPLVLEPWVETLREHTRSGFVRRDGTVAISRPCFQSVNAHGAWIATEHAPTAEVADEDDARLEEACAAAGSALAAVGYFGPFGIDAYHHRAASGHGVVLNPLSEINARFTMDWSTAMSASHGSTDAVERLGAMDERISST